MKEKSEIQALDLEADGAPERAGQNKVLRDLDGLMRDIAACRAESAHRDAELAGLERRLHLEVLPIEDKILAVRLETFRILCVHLEAGWLKKRARRMLREALSDLADELEEEGDLDLSEERRRFLGETPPTAEEKAMFEAMAAYLDARVEAARERIERETRAGGHGGGKRRKDGATEADRTKRAGEASAESATGAEGKGRAGKGRRQRPPTKAEERRRAQENALAGDVRALYLMLARALHPDKEREPALRREKTAWMQRVTSAYAGRDLPGLLDILARNPLGAVGPYLSRAPLKTLQGFSKRLRRELTALRREAGDTLQMMHPFLRQFLKAGRVDEAALRRRQGELRRRLSIVKERREIYGTREGLEELLEAMRRYGWQTLL